MCSSAWKSAGKLAAHFLSLSNCRHSVSASVLCHAIASWQLLPSPSCPQLFEPKWDHNVYSVANLQVSLLNILPSKASSVEFEWIFFFIVIQMVEILLHYADRTLKKCPDQGKIQVMEQHFQVWRSRALSCIQLLNILIGHCCKNSLSVFEKYWCDSPEVSSLCAIMKSGLSYSWVAGQNLYTHCPLQKCDQSFSLHEPAVGKTCSCASSQLIQITHWFCSVLANFSFVLCRVCCLAGILPVLTAFF